LLGFLAEEVCGTEATYKPDALARFTPRSSSFDAAAAGGNAMSSTYSGMGFISDGGFLKFLKMYMCEWKEL